MQTTKRESFIGENRDALMINFDAANPPNHFRSLFDWQHIPSQDTVAKFRRENADLIRSAYVRLLRLA